MLGYVYDFLEESYGIRVDTHTPIFLNSFYVIFGLPSDHPSDRVLDTSCSRKFRSDGFLFLGLQPLIASELPTKQTAFVPYLTQETQLQ